jgi:hypothetical protein
MTCGLQFETLESAYGFQEKTVEVSHFIVAAAIIL